MDLNAFLTEAMNETGTPRERRRKIEEEDLSARLDWYEKNTKGFVATAEHLTILKAIFNEHRNVFITGGAGVGKTTFVKSVIMPELDYRNFHWAVTATTGIAGSHLDGKTLHSFFGIGLGPNWRERYPRLISNYLDGVEIGSPTPRPQDMSTEELNAWYRMFYDTWLNDPKIKQSVRSGVMSRLRSHEVLLLDEVSMLHGAGMLGYLDFMLKEIRGSARPFGGLQMVFIGDFAQLPPVEEGVDSSNADWAFLSRAWTESTVKAIELTKVFRQGDLDFINFLNHIRDGNLTAEDRSYAANFVRTDMTYEDTKNYTFLVPTNNKATKINTGALENYEAPTVPLCAEFDIAPGVQKMKEWEIANIETVKDDLVKAMRKRLVDKTMFVRKGYPVMFTVNAPDGSYVNGTRGFVREVKIQQRTSEDMSDRDYVAVGIPGKTPEDPERLVIVYRRNYARNREQDTVEKVPVPSFWNENPENPKLPPYVSLYPSVRQFPLIPAVAITIHKCVDKDTLVPTTEGLTTIGDLCIMSTRSDPPQVAGMTGMRKYTEPFVGERELGYRITTARGYSIVCSDRHPLYCATPNGLQWIKAPDIKVGDKLRLRKGTRSFAPFDPKLSRDNVYSGEFCSPAEMSPDLALFLGLVYGGGGGPKIHRDRKSIDIRVSIDDEDLAKRDVRSLVCDLFGEEVKINTNTKTWKCEYLTLRSDFLVDWLSKLFPKAEHTQVPTYVLSFSDRNQRSFIRGCFVAAGAWSDPCFALISETMSFAKLLQTMLLNCGVVSKLESGYRNSKLSVSLDQYAYYCNYVGFDTHEKAYWNRAARKAPAVSRAADEVTYDRQYSRFLAELIPDIVRINQHNTTLRNHWLDFSKQIINDDDQRISDEDLYRLLHTLWETADDTKMFAALRLAIPNQPEEIVHVLWSAYRGCFLDAVVRIDRVNGDMRDICVPEGHAFIGNGFVNHNSQGMSMDSAILSLAHTFAPGHVYVGLSRLRSPEGMVLAEKDFTVRTDPLVTEFYRSIRENKT